MSEQWLYCKSTHKIQRSSCPFMSVQVLLRGDLASQWPSPFQSCRALLYLRIRRCLAKPLYCLAFYLKEKADLAPVALSPPCRSVCPPVSHCLTRSICLCIRLSLPPLSFSPLFVFTSLLSSVFLIPHLAFFSLSSVALFSPSLSPHIHTPHYSSISPTHLLS